MPWVTYTRDISVGCIRLPSRCCLSNISGIALGIMIKLVPVCTTSGIVPLEVVQKRVRESECTKKQQKKTPLPGSSPEVIAVVPLGCRLSS